MANFFLRAPFIQYFIDFFSDFIKYFIKYIFYLCHVLYLIKYFIISEQIAVPLYLIYILKAELFAIICEGHYFFFVARRD